MTGYLRDEKLIKQFGQRLKQLRLEKNLSQAELAYATNFSFTYISKIETGVVDTNLSHLAALSRALDIPLHLLMEFPDSKSSIL
jgi:transcriptional regulator with XRE-family HTH domain